MPKTYRRIRGFANGEPRQLKLRLALNKLEARKAFMDTLPATFRDLAPHDWRRLEVQHHTTRLRELVAEVERDWGRE